MEDKLHDEPLDKTTETIIIRGLNKKIVSQEEVIKIQERIINIQRTHIEMLERTIENQEENLKALYQMFDDLGKSLKNAEG